jgi:hypothetical protein
MPFEGNVSGTLVLANQVQVPIKYILGNDPTFFISTNENTPLSIDILLDLLPESKLVDDIKSYIDNIQIIDVKDITFYITQIEYHIPVMKDGKDDNPNGGSYIVKVKIKNIKSNLKIEFLKNFVVKEIDLNLSYSKSDQKKTGNISATIGFQDLELTIDYIFDEGGFPVIKFHSPSMMSIFYTIIGNLFAGSGSGAIGTIHNLGELLTYMKIPVPDSLQGQIEALNFDFHDFEYNLAVWDKVKKVNLNPNAYKYRIALDIHGQFTIPYTKLAISNFSINILHQKEPDKIPANIP